MALNKRKGGNYLSIIDGSIRQQVAEGTEGAIKREYETSDKTKGVKYELKFDSLSGIIIGLNFFDGNFGKQMSLVVKDEGKKYTLQLNVKQSYCEDLMRKLPSVDLSKEVELIPYDFEDEKGKRRQGINILQGEDKVMNYFVEKVSDTEYKAINGIPEPEGVTEDYDSDDWQIHYTKVRKFLVEHLTKNIMPKLEMADEPTGEKADDGLEYPEDDIDLSDIPF